MPTSTQAIWNPATGITDLEADGRDLAVSEVSGIKAVWRARREQRKGTPRISEFTERLGREWSIETGLIENLYEIDRDVAQTLIEQGFHAELLGPRATNRPREYVLQLLRDQKEVLEGVFDLVKDRRELSVSSIKELHAALLRSQATAEGVDSLGRRVAVPLVRGDWKTRPNSPEREGVTYLYCPPERVQDQMEQLVALHERHVRHSVPAEVQAGWLHHRFTQIHPFQDGNGRVARTLASLVLLQDGLLPLVVTREEKSRYFRSLEAADRGDLEPLVGLIAQLQTTQLRRAIAYCE